MSKQINFNSMLIELHHEDILNIFVKKYFLYEKNNAEMSAVLPVQPSMTAGLGTRASYEPNRF